MNVTYLHNSGNKTVAFLCANDHCINDTYVFDGVDHHADGSDEDYNHAQCYSDYFVYICLGGNLSRYIPLSNVSNNKNPSPIKTFCN